MHALPIIVTKYFSSVKARASQGTSERDEPAWPSTPPLTIQSLLFGRRLLSHVDEVDDSQRYP